MTKTKRRYAGGVDLEVVLPSGRTIVVAPGDTVELLANEAEALDARGDFEAPKGRTKESDQ
ncbi:MAG: hypothetical protein D6683_01365 [Actinomyces sp.]|nr:MAG: hypothetical protein D6683_01365 [Actinomyces sp.]